LKLNIDGNRKIVDAGVAQGYPKRAIMALNGNSVNSHHSGSGTTPKSLFPRGPSFTVENFSNKDFIVRDFVEELAESAIPVNRRSGPANQAFDPKPLIRHFESRIPFKSYHGIY
jgi:hypothetical protein